MEIVMKNFEFSQTTINTKRGESVFVKITNEQGAHNFAVPQLEINSGVLKEGESMVIEIQIPEDAPQSYEFASTFDNNNELGMVGTILID
ncbi:MAG: hypothetical protein HC932_02645 [Thermales bacterium]|nr:hypothetical protein [Thermales bacterium]